MCFSFLCCCRSRNAQREQLTCPEEYMKTLQASTHLKTGQISHLYKCFCNLAKDYTDLPATHLKKKYFLSLDNLHRNPILSILLTSMFGDKKQITFVEFAKYLSLFEAYGTALKKEQIEEIKQKKLKLLFNMYDNDKNGVLTEEDLIFVVHKLFSEIWDPQKIVQVVTMMMSEMDSTHTNQILFNDFCTAYEVFDMEEQLITKIHGGGVRN